MTDDERPLVVVLFPFCVSCRFMHLLLFIHYHRDVSSTDLGIDKLKKKFESYPGLVGRDIVEDVTVKKPYSRDKPVIDVLSENQQKPPIRKVCEINGR